jgi:predicted RNase H-like HicB family nuclease
MKTYKIPAQRTTTENGYYVIEVDDDVTAGDALQEFEDNAKQDAAGAFISEEITDEQIGTIGYAKEIPSGEMCSKHPAFEADNCPGCGTSMNLDGSIR